MLGLGFTVTSMIQHRVQVGPFVTQHVHERFGHVDGVAGV